MQKIFQNTASANQKLKSRLNLRKPEEENKRAELNRQLKDLGEKLNRLYEAIENGLVSMDETLKQRVSDLQLQREGIQAELKMLVERKEVSLRITPTEIAAFTTALKEKTAMRRQWLCQALSAHAGE